MFSSARPTTLAVCALVAALGITTVAYAQSTLKSASVQKRNACKAKYPVKGPSDKALSVQAECTESGGSGCAAPEMMTKDAVACIAHASKLKQGIEPWEMSLLYDGTAKRPVWSITNIEGKSGAVNEHTTGSIYGTMATFDAITGEKLSEEPYSIGF